MIIEFARQRSERQHDVTWSTVVPGGEFSIAVCPGTSYFLGKKRGEEKMKHHTYPGVRTAVRKCAWSLFVAGLTAALVTTEGCKKSSITGADDTILFDSIAIAANHETTTLGAIPESFIRKAKRELRIAYGHTSHGSQLVDGMNGLVQFRGTLFSFNSTGADSALVLRDTPFSGASDLGNPDRTAWATATRTYLSAHPEINVVIWSWCGQVSDATAANIETYLSLMNGLEQSFQNVAFIYMTGHLDGSGMEGNLHKRNQQIRAYCAANNKKLFDFADIETWTPDGVSLADKKPNDNCDYDSNGDGVLDKNWAIDWQNAHPGEWFNCGSAHSQPLNANRKAYAAWWLWARLAGWNGVTG
jgi:hypothetical protein